MYIVNAEEMRKLDQAAIQAMGGSPLRLMENAGRAVAEETLRYMEARGLGREKPWLILIGKGHNGGDGLVAARHLRELGVTAELWYAVSREKLSPDAALQADAAEQLGVHTVSALEWARYAGVIDGLLGTGTSGAPREPYAQLIREANRSGLPIVAIDIPSGLDADTGQLHDPCIRAELTVTLAFMKRGLVQYPGAAQAGEVVVRQIGIPEALAENHPVRTFSAGERLFRERFGVTWPLQRQADTHKGTYGHVLVVAGSRQYSGAGLLAARAALRSGAGLVSWAVPERLVDPMLGHAPEAMLVGVPDGGRGDWAQTDPAELLRLAEGKSAVVLGPGFGRFEGDAAWLRELWQGLSAPLVLDADALSMLAEARGSWPARQAPAVLTPHPGEMARLCGCSPSDVQRDRIGLARRYAEQHGVTLVLKGARTVTAAPDGDVYVNRTGNPGMATGGAGDVLAGLIGGLLAQGHPAAVAAALGAHWHGEAGDRAAASRATPYSLVAGDIIDAL